MASTDEGGGVSRAHHADDATLSLPACLSYVPITSEVQLPSLFPPRGEMLATDVKERRERERERNAGWMEGSYF